VSGYLSLLKIAPVRRMLLAAFLSRVPMAILGLATVLFLHEEGRSYAVAGLVGGAIGFGIATSAVLQARVVERRGRASLAAVAAAFAAAAVGLIVGGTQGWTALVLAPLGLAVGALMPASSSIVRGLYPAAVSARPELERSVFALDSALTESTYIGGPSLVAFTVAVASAAVAIAAAVVAAVCSVVTLLRTPAATTPTPESERPSRGRSRYPNAVVVLALASFPVGFGFGVNDVAFPAFASAHHHPALAGVLLALGATVSAVSGLAYGAVSGRVHTTSVLFAGAFLYPISFAMPALATSVLTMCFLALPVGLATGWWATARNHLLNVASPPELRTSANGWVLLSVYLGASAGLAIGGLVVSAAGWRAAFVVGGSVAAGLTIVTLLGRAALLDPTHGLSPRIPRPGAELSGLLTEDASAQNVRP
jgi:MFS family permease